MVKEALVVSLALVLQEKTIRFMIISFFFIGRASTWSHDQNVTTHPKRETNRYNWRNSLCLSIPNLRIIFPDRLLSTRYRLKYFILVKYTETSKNKIHVTPYL